MKRKYFRYTTKDLRELAYANQKNCKILKEIKNELKFRRKPQAKNLYREIDEYLKKPYQLNLPIVYNHKISEDNLSPTKKELVQTTYKNIYERIAELEKQNDPDRQTKLEEQIDIKSIDEDNKKKERTIIKIISIIFLIIFAEIFINIINGNEFNVSIQYGIYDILHTFDVISVIAIPSIITWVISHKIKNKFVLWIVFLLSLFMALEFSSHFENAIEILIRH